MLTPAAKARNTTPHGAPVWRVGLAPSGAPSGLVSLAIAAVLALLFAGAITCALQPAHLADPLQTSLQNGL